MIDVMYLLRELPGVSFEDLVLYIQKLNRELIKKNLEPVLCDVANSSFISDYQNIESVIINFVKRIESEKVDLNLYMHYNREYLNEILEIQSKLRNGNLFGGDGDV